MRCKIAKWTLLILLVLHPAGIASAQNVQIPLEDFDLQVRQWASECKQTIVETFENLLTTGRLTEAQLFDTFYIPIPGTYPQKYHTQYDRVTDETLQDLLDKTLNKDERLVFVVLVDRNGYLPTHNTRYSQPLTGDPETDLNGNRTKRIFNDRTGLAAAQNTRPYLLQRYFRDTGEEMFDMSVPVFIRDRHWGAVRIGYGYK